jgi:Pyruvate/2-oxoacid:ferredoxin oxidoreductase delta subunit
MGDQNLKPYVIKKKCPAQKDICKVIPICPTGAIRYLADEAEPLGGRIVIDETLCNGCGLCVTECCGLAIVAQQA